MGDKNPNFQKKRQPPPAPSSRDGDASNASRSRSRDSEGQPEPRAVIEDLDVDETLLRELEGEWTRGAVFYNSPRTLSEALPSPFRYTGSIEDPVTGKIHLADDVLELHRMGWFYLLRARLFDDEGGFKEYNAYGIKEAATETGRLKNVISGLRMTDSGAFNRFFEMAYPTGEEYSVVDKYLRNVVGYTAADLQTSTFGNGPLPYGIGVRIGKKSLLRDDTRFQAFLELQIGLLLAAHNLAPPILASFVLQTEMEPNVQEGHSEIPSFAKAGSYDVVTLMASGKCSLSELFRQINERGVAWCKASEKWLNTLGRAILDTITNISNLGFILLDAKPGNFVYLGMNLETTPMDTADKTLENHTPKVWAVDFGTYHTGRVNPRSDNFHCVEMVNLLMFLNIVQCLYLCNLADQSEFYAPVADVVMRPLRERMHVISQSFKYRGNQDRGGESGDFCKYLEATMLQAEEDLPLMRNLDTPPDWKLRYTAQRLKTVAKRYAGLWGTQGKDRGCFPYKDDEPLLPQMIEYLSEFRRPAASNWEARKAWKGVTSTQPARQYDSVVDQVFAEFRRPAASNREARKGVFSTQAARQYDSVVDQVFAEFRRPDASNREARKGVFSTQPARQYDSVVDQVFAERRRAKRFSGALPRRSQTPCLPNSPGSGHVPTDSTA